MAFTQSSVLISAPSDTTKCHILSIPPVIRNRIYNLCFAAASREVNLLVAEPPSKNLLLACKSICTEAGLMRRKAYQDFWIKSAFEIVQSTAETWFEHMRKTV